MQLRTATQHDLWGGWRRQVADTPGTLTRITEAIASAGVNVQSLAVGGSEQQGRSRITMVVPRDQEGLPRLTALVLAPPPLPPPPPRPAAWCTRRTPVTGRPSRPMPSLDAFRPAAGTWRGPCCGIDGQPCRADLCASRCWRHSGPDGSALCVAGAHDHQGLSSPQSRRQRLQ